jgi:hypothetical protein
MQFGVYILVNLRDHLRNRRARSQLFHNGKNLLFAQLAMGDIFGNFRLGIGDVRTVRGHNFSDLKTLQAFERVQIIQHVPIWRRDNVGGNA